LRACCITRFNALHESPLRRRSGPSAERTATAGENLIDRSRNGAIQFRIELVYACIYPLWTTGIPRANLAALDNKQMKVGDVSDKTRRERSLANTPAVQCDITHALNCNTGARKPATTCGILSASYLSLAIKLSMIARPFWRTDEVGSCVMVRDNCVKN
jgi:hypothetical protein